VNLPFRHRSTRASTALTWLRIFLWVFPGLSFTPLVIVVREFTATLLIDRWVVVGCVLACTGLITLVCAYFDSLLHLTPLHGRENVRPGLLLRQAALFLGVQILFAPALALFTLALVSEYY
jgi:hypothetical protein